MKISKATSLLVTCCLLTPLRDKNGAYGWILAIECSNSGELWQCDEVQRAAFQTAAMEIIGS